MEFIFAIVIIFLWIQNAGLNKKLRERPSALPVYVPEHQDTAETDSLRRAAENALRTKAETLLPRYERSGLVHDLLMRIQEGMKYDDVLWDITFNNNDIEVTYLTDIVDNRRVLMKEIYNFQEMGFESPPKESYHRLAFALAMQKCLGADFGVNYQFRFDPSDQTHTISQLMLNYRKKRQSGTTLKSPI